MSSPRHLALLSLSAIALVSAAVAPAASAQVLEPGMRIRVTGTDGSRRVGTVSTVQRDTVLLNAPGGAPFAVATSDVARLELSRGRQRNFAGNFAITTVGLMVLGGGIGAVSWSECTSEGWGCMFTPDSRSDALLAGALVGGLVGVPLGIVVGAAVRQERWTRIDHERNAASPVSVRPVLGDRVGFAATLRYE